MGKIGKVSREVTDRDVGCLENLVVAYNTIFLMSSIFIISIAGTTQELFADFLRFLPPSVLLTIIGAFTVLIAGIGYVGVGKKSSTLMSTYTLLLLFVFVCEIIGGLEILSFRREIKSVVTRKMKRAMMNYPFDQKTANLVDFVQLELSCCGINNYSDWNETFIDYNSTSNCRTQDFVLPESCCFRLNSTSQFIQHRGCLPALHYMLHRSSLMLTTAIIAICIVQVSGAYFSYSLSSTLRKYKIQKMANFYPQQNQATEPTDYREKSNNYY